MAKKKGTATPSKVQQQRESSASMDALKEKLRAIDADVDAELEELERKRQEKKTAAVADLRGQVDALKQQRDGIDGKIDELEGLIADLTGIKAKRGRKAASGGGSRLKQSDKEQYMADALRFIEGKEGGVGRSEVAEKLGLDSGPTATILKALKAAKKVKVEGERSQAKYVAA